MTPDNPKDSPTDLLRELETLQRVLDDAAGDQVSNGLNIPVLDPMDDIPVLDDLFSGDDIPVLKAVPRRSATVTQLPVQKAAPAAVQEEAPATISQPEPIASLPADEDDDILPAAEATAPLMPAAGVHADEAPGSGVSANAAEASAAPSDVAATNEASSNQAPTNAASTNEAPTKTSSNPFLPQAILDRLAQEREAAQQSAQEAHRTMQRVMEQKQARAQQALAGMGKTLTQVQKDALIEQLIAEMLPAITERLREKLKHTLNL